MSETQSPKLLALPEDGRPRKPEDVEGEDITVLDQIRTRLADGRDSAKWVIRRANGEATLIWAPGYNPMAAVAQWFRDNPGRPLPCRIYRGAAQGGFRPWQIEQRDQDSGQGQSGVTTTQQSVDAQLDEVGL